MMPLKSRFTGNVSKLQLPLKQQRLLLFIAALSLLLSFLISRTKRFYLVQSHPAGKPGA